MNRNDLMRLDVNKLFEERNIDEIIEIEKLLDAEIERKRNDLRSMVGDRYKDILAASDAIKSMKEISQNIVSSIDKITRTCEDLVQVQNRDPAVVNKEKANGKSDHEERTLIIQVRLAIFLNEQIWLALDNGLNLDATQYYLLAQHIHLGFNLTQNDHLTRVPLLKHLKASLSTLRENICEHVTGQLESVELTSEEASKNLNALMLLENKTIDHLLSIFIDHRKTALQSVINTQYDNVRLQICAMVKCLVTTVLLLHDCFIYNESKNGLIWKELDSIVGNDAPATLTKLKLPITPLVSYIPDIIRTFKPKLDPIFTQNKNEKLDKVVVDSWLEFTQKSIDSGLGKSLQHVTTVKGLYLIREESLKIELPDSWPTICSDLLLPDNFDIWYHFFQNLITLRAQELISKIILKNINELNDDIKSTLNNSKLLRSELDLRWYSWKENNEDVSKMEDNHIGLSMKTKGYSKLVVQLCEKLDKKYLGLLEDVSQYLYGTEYTGIPSFPFLIGDFKYKRKFIDKEQLENHLMTESTNYSLGIATYITNLVSLDSDPDLVQKSLLCARFLQASCALCTHFRTCCEFGKAGSEWQRICDTFKKTSQNLWSNWVKKTVEETGILVNKFDCTEADMLTNLSKWDEIEIQEQAEEKVFNSQIKVPLKPSIPLTKVLVKLNQDLSQVLPFTLPKAIHVLFIEANVNRILKKYEEISTANLNQIQALQYLLDVRYLTTLCIPRENTTMVNYAQTICDKLRGKIDPFDLDVFYSYLQTNVKKAVGQSQLLFGCLLPSSAQLVNLGAYAKPKEQEKNPSLMSLSTPSTNAWFPLLPITAPSQRIPGSGPSKPKFTV
ncbi:conserved oligomeric Golgi complex subunit 1 isoform X2 [Anthonomus grandis grandis]|uniref:conserved oligomeric Golgi complex subunit 1 isoform X2 n=1 Tax=Anthonomus grandis grandis TaxID=2921223 RepID=UPI0021658D2D|nr:conserved oligomeric Golgi complex subunit 1 isoform X2 [Anthonomus grandis grandis]